MDDMISCVMNKMTFSAFRSKLYEAHKSKAMRHELSYVSAVKELRRLYSNQEVLQGDKEGNLISTVQTCDRYIWDYRLHSKADAKRERFPSVAWLIERWHDWSALRAEFFDRRMMVIHKI